MRPRRRPGDERHASSALAPLRSFGLTRVIVSTMQAVSGAGYPGVPSLDILGNVVPFIGGDGGSTAALRLGEYYLRMAPAWFASSESERDTGHHQERALGDRAKHAADAADDTRHQGFSFLNR